MLKIFKTTFLLLALSASVSMAQTIGGSIVLASPQGEFRQHVDRFGYGLSAQATFSSPGAFNPVTFGLHASYIIYGEESGARPLSYTIPDVTVDVNRKNSIANLHLLMVVSPFPGPIKPYMEGLAGGSYIFTTTDVESQYSNWDVFETNNYDDFAWSYGGGAGIMFNLTPGGLGELASFSLDLKVRYLFGTEAEYLREGDIHINPDNGSVYYDVSRSETDLLTFQLGVIASF